MPSIYKYGAVLGNGPSYVNYNGEAEIVIGCNIPPCQVDATVIVDVEVVSVLHKRQATVDCPLIVSSQVFERMKELKVLDEQSIITVFRTSDWYSSAHYAAEYLIGVGCSKIDVWGCDMVFSDTEQSLTDQYIWPKPKPFIIQWRRTWQMIVTKHTEIDFVFHKPDLH